MKLSQVVNDVYRLDFGIVSAFLLARDGLALIDTGLPGCETQILAAIEAIGRNPKELGHILLTHLHADHSGAAAALQAATGAKLWMHSAEAATLREGGVMRPVSPGPGLANKALSAIFRHAKPMRVTPFELDGTLDAPCTLPIAEGLEVVPAPGHTVGHTAFLWPHEGGALFSGDAYSALFGLGYSPIYEDLEQGRATVKALAKLDFAVACPSHGKPIADAKAAFGRKWGG